MKASSLSPCSRLAVNAVGVLGLLVISLVTGAAAQNGRVEGTVLNLRTGEPVSEAKVTIEGRGGLFALTDRQGRYIIIDVPAGVYNVRVEAAGFELKVHLNHRVMSHDRRMSDIQPVRLDIGLRPKRFSAEGPSTSTSSRVAIRSGVGFGVSMGGSGLVGAANRFLDPGRSTDLFVRYGTPFGLALHVGGHFGKLGVDSVSRGLGVNGFYVDPRFLLLHLSPKWAPFVATQFALTWEGIQTERAEFTATGRSAGVGFGAVYRLAAQVVLEGGVSVGVATQDDYRFRGDFVSYRCMEEVEVGTVLPESIVRC